MANAEVNININAKNNTKAVAKKVEMNLREMGEKVSSLGMRMSAAFTLPVVALGKMVLENEKVKAAMAPVAEAFGKVKDELAVALLPVIKELTPALINLAGSISTVIQWFSSLPIGTKEAIVAFVGVVAAVGPVVAIIGQVINVIGTLQMLLPGVTAAISAMGGSAIVAAGPIIALGAALGVLFYVINTYGPAAWNTLKQIAAILAKPFMSNGAWLEMIAKWGLIQGKAAGGSVTGGRPYVVGEAGPELFVPRQSGSIVPNSRISGGNTYIINYSPALGIAERQTVIRDLRGLIGQVERGR